MIEFIYNMLGGVQVFIYILLVARYVFHEPPISKYRKFIHSLMITVIGLTYLCAGEDAGIMCMLLCAGVHLFIARRKSRLQGFFLVLPILGLLFGVLMPFLHTIEMLLPTQETIERCSIAFDLVTIILLLLFRWRGKGWRIRFEQELQYRQLRKWEKRFLVGVGWLLIVVYGTIGKVPVIDDSVKFFIVMVNIAIFILTVAVMGLVLRGNRGDYYEAIAKLNEHYLEMELQHFEAYKLSQKEVRRIQHDMKHHVACLQHLCKQDNVEEIQDYLNNMGELIYSVDMDINCGNALANSICTHKYQIAAQKGIRMEVIGKMPEQINLKSIDLCTILANALDNAIEAVENLEEAYRWIRFEISSQGKMLFFRFSNPMNEEINTIEMGATTKKEKVYHGFGLQNINYAVEKYHGQMLIEIERKKGAEFVLSIVVGEEKII